MLDIQCIASDLDGTLLNDESQISEFTKETINTCLEQSLLFVPCSARTMKLIDPWLLEHPGIQYIVSSNGAIIYDKKTLDFCYRKTIPATQALEIIHAVKSENIYWTIDTNNALYSNKRIIDDAANLDISSSFLENLLQTRIFIESPEEILSRPENDVRKIHFITKTAEIKKSSSLLASSFDSIRITSSHESNIEITHVDATKGKALAYILSREFIPIEKSIAFGDNNNDIDFLSAAGHGCSMENATEDLKKVSTCSTCSNDDNGVACFIHENILLPQ